jgi:thiopeptide-type bacteriocin biosynthesis protein
MKAPGSEWLFVKLYCPETFQEDVLAYPIRTFAPEALAAGWAEEWFFVRYHDPDLHIRLRFRGERERITGQLLPQLCAWAAKLMDESYCTRFCLDTYERELERYGGPAGMALAESLFAIDSQTISDILYLTKERAFQMDKIALAVLSIDQSLAHFGLDEAARLQWLRQYVTSRNEVEVGQAYRQHKALLRSLLGQAHTLLDGLGSQQLMQVFERQQEALAPITARLRELAEQGILSVSLDALYSSYVHMHCNRLLGTDRVAERKVMGLLLRTREGLERCGL